MSSYKSARFSQEELELVKLWALPNVSGQPETHKAPEVEPPVILAEDLPPVLTVEEIEAMQKQAYDEAYQHGKTAGFADGFQEGREAGLIQGYEENLQLLQEQAEQYALLMTALAEPFKTLDAEVEQELVRLAIAMATQIIRRELKLDPGQIIAAVREAVGVLPLSSQKITLHLHPEDAELVRSSLSLDELSSAWTMVEDPLITRGGCKVDTEISRVDASVENRLAAVIATVLGGEREQDRSRRDGAAKTPQKSESSPQPDIAQEHSHDA